MYVHCIAESINIMGTRIGKAMKERDPGPIQLMANEEVADGADFLDLNIGPARKEGHELMKYGLWSAIVDTYDHELIKLAHGERPELVNLVHDIMEDDEPDPSTLSPKELEYYKTTRVLMGKTIFSESWLDL